MEMGEDDICTCRFENADINPVNLQCEALFDDITTDVSTSYLIHCLSNTQITINLTTYLSSSQMQILKDDSCSPVNVYISGVLQVQGNFDEVSGFVNTITTNFS